MKENETKNKKGNKDRKEKKRKTSNDKKARKEGRKKRIERIFTESDIPVVAHSTPDLWIL